MKFNNPYMYPLLKWGKFSLYYLWSVVLFFIQQSMRNIGSERWVQRHPFALSINLIITDINCRLYAMLINKPQIVRLHNSIRLEEGNF